MLSGVTPRLPIGKDLHLKESIGGMGEIIYRDADIVFVTPVYAK